MRKRSAQMGVWLFFLIFLSLSRSSSASDGNGRKCNASSMRVVCGEEGGNRSPYCDQKLSSQCEIEEAASGGSTHGCHDTLSKNIEDSHGCKERKLGKNCGGISSSLITPPKEPLVYLRLYYHHSPDGLWGNEARVNVTMPAPTWKELFLQLSVIGDNGYLDKESNCRSFSLETVMNSTLMYECRFRRQWGDESKNFRFTVKSDSGEGANYLFKTPPATMINPEETCPSDWHVFFYVHQDAIQRYDPLPVTVQSSPYGQVEYRVTLAKCRDSGDKNCSDEVYHELYTRNTTDDLWTVELPAITTGGNYAVRVQMVADWCGPDGCYVSVSPILEIPPSYAWIYLLSSICLILTFIIFIVTKLYERNEQNKKFFVDLKSRRPNVLLAYHPESLAALDFVRKLAEFLKNTCCVTPLLVDDEVGTGNPSDWTRDKMNDPKNRVLFLVPKDSMAQSSTPIRNQWDVALGECNSDQFITNQNNIKRLAKLVHPNSGSVPREIRNIRCFDLSDNPSALANWLHGGSFLDQIFLWLPHIRSSAKKNINPTWTQVQLAAQNIGTSLKNGPVLPPLIAPSPGNSEIALVVPEDEESTNDECNDSDGCPFDPVIPGFPEIQDISSPEPSGDEDDGVYY